MIADRNSYIEDVEAWLWVTKGVRFYTHERYLAQNKWSNIAIGMMSAYIIIINLITIYKIPLNIIIQDNTVSFISTALSILILVFSQLENSNNFKLKAERFHDCAREVSKLYRLLREKKRENIIDSDLNIFLLNITQNYELILDKYENHKEIDFLYFKSRHPKEFPISSIRKYQIKIKYYLNTLFIYHLLIISPIIILYFYK